eukprot:2730560-Alexandrium_andersonii.AAC.1
MPAPRAVQPRCKASLVLAVGGLRRGLVTGAPRRGSPLMGPGPVSNRRAPGGATSPGPRPEGEVSHSSSAFT